MSTEKPPLFERRNDYTFNVSFYLENEDAYDELAELVMETDKSWTFHDLENARYSAEDLAFVSLKLFELNGK